jgi:hypothetical protein
MKPPSKPQDNPMKGSMRPTFFTESRLKGETTTEKSVRNEKESNEKQRQRKERNLHQFISLVSQQSTS